MPLRFKKILAIVLRLFVAEVGQTISGTGWRPSVNNYLVVEALDGSRKFIQGQITSRVWNMPAHFGDASTPSGARFDVYALSTPTKLPLGEIRFLPNGGIVARRVTVIA
jgi:hypothetical protein